MPGPDTSSIIKFLKTSFLPTPKAFPFEEAAKSKLKELSSEYENEPFYNSFFSHLTKLNNLRPPLSSGKILEIFEAAIKFQEHIEQHPNSSFKKFIPFSQNQLFFLSEIGKLYIKTINILNADRNSMSERTFNKLSNHLLSIAEKAVYTDYDKTDETAELQTSIFKTFDEMQQYRKDYKNQMFWDSLTYGALIIVATIGAIAATTPLLGFATAFSIGSNLLAFLEKPIHSLRVSYTPDHSEEKTNNKLKDAIQEFKNTTQGPK